MIVDTSAVAAVFFREEGCDQLIDALSTPEHVGIGAPTLAETGVVLTARLGPGARSLIGRFLQEFGIEVVPFGPLHWREAFDAYERFGKGRHRAALNFGDCLTYAVAKLARQPLLCAGEDFRETDLELAPLGGA